MSYLPETKAALVRGDRVGQAILVELMIASGPQRYFNGVRRLRAGGREWLGLGDMLSISGLEQPAGGTAPPTTFTLSGVTPDMIAAARNGSVEVKNRPVTVYLQFVGEARPLDEPLALWAGIMDTLKFAGSGPSDRRIVLTAETLFVRRRRAPFGYYTDADQQARFPGDRGMEFTAALVNKTVPWLYQ